MSRSKSLLFYSFLLVGMLWCQSAHSQITINHKDYPFKPGFDSFMIDENPANSFVPKGGANKVWDYSGLSVNEWGYEYFKDETGNTAFPTATHSQAAAYTFNNFEYRSTDYFRFDKNGNAAIGRTQYDTSFSLAMVTGGPNDLFRYPQADVPFPEERQYMFFPMDKESVYEGVDIQDTRFELTVAAFGLNKTPGNSKRWRYQKREVIGWGQIIIPDGKGGKTDPINVLAIHITDSIIDSFYLAGQPAPAALLTAFGAQQGLTRRYDAYAFETIGLGRQVAGVVTGWDDKINHTYVRPQAGKLGVGVDDLTKLPQVSVYPSVLQKDGMLNVVTDNKATTTSVMLLGQDGKQHVLHQNGEGQFALPADLSSGVYVYVVNDPSNHQMASGKLMVME